MSEETHEAHGAHGHAGGDRFRIVVAIGIALVSVLGAVVAFRGTLAEQDAHRLFQQGIQDVSQREQITTDLEATVNSDLRNLVPYQEHVRAARLLTQQADQVRAQNPALADTLTAEAKGEVVLARTQLSFFVATTPTVDPKDGSVTYDEKGALQRLIDNNAQLKQVRPEATIAAAEDLHSKTVYLQGLVTLFVAALLFLTIAEFARGRIRNIFAGSGALAGLTGVVLWIVVERHFS